MKLPLFDYASPTSVAEVVDLLVRYQGEARVISGGQSLMPMLAFRLATPSLIVDLRHVGGLDRIEINESGIELGAKVRLRDIEDNRRLATAHPLLVEAVKHVAHYQIRNRGTVGGSLAHADPAAELPCIAATCEADLRLLGPGGERRVKAADFFLGPLTTALAGEEIILEVRLPP